MLLGEKKKRNKTYYAFFKNIKSSNRSHSVADCSRLVVGVAAPRLRAELIQFSVAVLAATPDIAATT